MDAWKALEAHRGWHKCRGHACEEAKRLRHIWAVQEESEKWEI